MISTIRDFKELTLLWNTQQYTYRQDRQLGGLSTNTAMAACVKEQQETRLLYACGRSSICLIIFELHHWWSTMYILTKEIIKSPLRVLVRNEAQNLFRSLSDEKATSLSGRHDRVLLTYLDGFEGTHHPVLLSSSATVKRLGSNTLASL